MPDGSAIKETGPALTVVLVAQNGFGQIRRTTESLAAQTIADRIELVVMAPDAGSVAEGAPLFAWLHSSRVVTMGPIDNVDRAVARGLLEGRAPIVAPIEDHAFPEPEWAERLLEAWTEDCAGVGPAIINANPRSGLSWANALIAYGAWSEGTPEGPHEASPIHNGSFSREALAPIADWLEEGWNREGAVLALLRERGGSFRFTPRARVRHVNPSTVRATAALRFDAGRLYAAERARKEGWGAPKRLAYVLLGPAIPLLRYARMRGSLFGADRVMEARRGPWLLLGLAFDAAGQMAGFLAGRGGSRERLAVFEMDRARHLGRADREAFATPGTASDAARGATT